MPLKPEVQDVLDLIASMPATPITELQPEELRANFRALVAPPTEAVASVDGLVVDGADASFGVRVYRPEGSAADDVLPVLLWFHGGGFVIGDLDTADSQCRALANGARAVV